MREELEDLLQESLTECFARERRTFDSLTSNKPNLVLFGAGGLGRKVLARLRQDGVEPLCFVDNRLAGQTIDGVVVLSPTQGVEQYGQTATFVVTIWASWADSMLAQINSLTALGCQSVISFIPLLWKYSDLLPHTQVDLPSRVLTQGDEIRQCFDLWSDSESQREFLSQLRWRLYGDFEALNPPRLGQYWQTDLLNFDGDCVFVDAGAFDGDTITQFVSITGGRFRAAFAFEPDQQNVKVLQERLERMPADIRFRVQVTQAAVGEKNEQIPFAGGAGASSIPGLGDKTVPCVALDTVMTETPSFIKFDIEGFELKGLSGTRRIISASRPSLAVCVYHEQDHLWRIPNLISSFNQNYRFYLRPHGQIWETVCYAIPT